MDKGLPFLFRNVEPIDHQILSRANDTLTICSVYFKKAKTALFKIVIAHSMSPLKTIITFRNRIVKLVTTTETVFTCSWQTTRSSALGGLLRFFLKKKAS